VFAIAPLAFASLTTITRSGTIAFVTTAALLTIGSAIATVALTRAADADFRRSVGPNPVWVDRADSGVDASFIYTGDVWSDSVGRILFWNRSVRSLAALEPVGAGPLPHRLASVARDGAVRGLAAGTRFVVSSSVIQWRGTRRRAVAGLPHLALWQLKGSPHMTSWIHGLNEKSELYSNGSVRIFGHRGALVRIRLAANVASVHASIAATGRPTQVTQIPYRATRVITVTVPDARARRVSITVTSPVAASIRVMSPAG
jgi:hypothetical protein